MDKQISSSQAIIRQVMRKLLKEACHPSTPNKRFVALVDMYDLLDTNLFLDNEGSYGKI